MRRVHTLEFTIPDDQWSYKRMEVMMGGDGVLLEVEVW